MIDPSVEGGIIRCRRQDLQSKNIQSFLRDGCEINQMALTWREQVSFVLCHDYTFKSLRFLDAVKEIVDDIQAESPEQQFDADFVIMTDTLHNMMGFVTGLFTDSGALESKGTTGQTEAVESNSSEEALSEVMGKNDATKPDSPDEAVSEAAVVSEDKAVASEAVTAG